MLLRSVALGSSAVELVAVRWLLVLILLHQRTLSGSTHSQFETVLLLCRCDRKSLFIQSFTVDAGTSARFPRCSEQNISSDHFCSDYYHFNISLINIKPNQRTQGSRSDSVRR